MSDLTVDEMVRAIEDALPNIRNILAAHERLVRSALAGETPESLVEVAAKAMYDRRKRLLGTWDEIADESGEGARREFLEDARAALAPLLVQLQDKEERIKALETALRPFADLAGSSEGFCSPQSVGERTWCNTHQAAYDQGECNVVKADKVLRGAP